jgi:hypothetical protein
MSAQVAHATQPAAAPEARPLRAAPPMAPRPSGSDRAASEEPRDRDRGLSLLYVFTGATVIMVGDVVLAAAIGHMWILVPVMGVHLLMTVAVFVAIMRLLADDGRT